MFFHKEFPLSQKKTAPSKKKQNKLFQSALIGSCWSCPVIKHLCENWQGFADMTDAQNPRLARTCETAQQ